LALRAITINKTLKKFLKMAKTITFLSFTSVNKGNKYEEQPSI
jgi:hypothetical protein